MKKTTGWFGESRKHSEAARKGQINRRRKTLVNRVICSMRKKLESIGKSVTKDILANLVIGYLASNYGMDSLLAKKYVMMALA